MKHVESIFIAIPADIVAALKLESGRVSIDTLCAGMTPVPQVDACHLLTGRHAYPAESPIQGFTISNDVLCQSCLYFETEPPIRDRGLAAFLAYLWSRRREHTSSWVPDTHDPLIAQNRMSSQLAAGLETHFIWGWGIQCTGEGMADVWDEVFTNKDDAIATASSFEGCTVSIRPVMLHKITDLMAARPASEFSPGNPILLTDMDLEFLGTCESLADYENGIGDYRPY